MSTVLIVDDEESILSVTAAILHKQGYRAVGLFVGALILLGTLGAWWGTRDAPVRRASTSSRWFSAPSKP